MFTMSLARTLAFLLVLAQETPVSAAATLPDTLLGRIAVEWTEAINSGSPEPLFVFVERWMSANAYRRESADSYVAIFRKFQEQSGGIDLIDVSLPDATRPMTLLVRTRKGDRYAHVGLGLDEVEPEKLAGMGIDRAQAPTAEREASWPAGKLSDKQMIAAIRGEIDRRANDGSFSGVVLVGRDDKILLHEAQGMADREAKIPNKLSTKFHLASVGKMFTAAAITLLVRDGKLNFDDTVAAVMPDFPRKDIAQKIIIHDLLTHTAGLGTFFESPGYAAGRNYRTSLEEIAVYRDEPLFFEPGKRWRYSNAGYSLLGAIIERVSRMEYNEFLRRRIFQPLGMGDTAADFLKQSAPAVATFYSQSPDDPLGVEPFTPDPSWKQRRRTGFGEGYSNARDLFLFARALRTGKLLGSDLLTAMIGSKVDQDGRSAQYSAYGIVEKTINGRVVRGHTGGGRADVEMLWDDGYTVIVLQNATPPAAHSFANEILGFIARQLTAK